MSNDFAQFQDAFFEEAAEHLGTVEEGLLQLERHPDDMELLNRIFRAVHSIKGNSGMFGFATISQFTHKMESVLDRLRNRQMAVSGPVMETLLKATDLLKTLIEAAKSNAPTDESVVGLLSQQLDTCQTTPSASPAAAQLGPMKTDQRGRRTSFLISWVPPRNLFRRGLDPVQTMRELERIGTLAKVKLDSSRLPDITSLDPEECYLAWVFDLVTTKDQDAVEAVFEFVREEGNLRIMEVPIEEDPAGPAERPSHPNGDARSESGRKPLGEILLESGAISPPALSQALAQQKKLGEILVAQKAVTPQQITQALEKQEAQAKKLDSTSIRVETGKIDKLINLVGELVITQSMLSDLGARFELRHLPLLLERMAQLERNTREIQERVMGIRMLPIGTAFSRFPRLVRDLAAKSGKKIQLVLSGEETEVDKTVIESIGDPLTHLIRNSADHGLEPPAERLKSNKSEQGTIRLNACHAGGNICITVEDDGRGLNRDKILAKAVAQGLITEHDKLSDDQIWALIFKPGFSTAEKVTDVSGRGVGMDVVKRNIEGLGGTVCVRTAPGKGTVFTLKLPLTLAIIDGMSVRIGKETYIVPLLSILESIQPGADAIKTVVGKGELVNVRGTYLPMTRLYEVFATEPEHTDPNEAILLILEAEGERVAVMVDEILGQQQVVIKSMEQNFRKVEGIAGATILGDGTVGFILDVRGLLDIARRAELMAA